MLPFFWRLHLSDCGPSDNSAIAELGLENFERQAEGFHQCLALAANGSIHLNAETITQFGVLLQVLLNGRVADVGCKGSVVGVDL